MWCRELRICGVSSLSWLRDTEFESVDLTVVDQVKISIRKLLIHYFCGSTETGSEKYLVMRLW